MTSQFSFVLGSISRKNWAKKCIALLKCRLWNSSFTYLKPRYSKPLYVLIGWHYRLRNCQWHWFHVRRKSLPKTEKKRKKIEKIEKREKSTQFLKNQNSPCYLFGCHIDRLECAQFPSFLMRNYFDETFGCVFSRAKEHRIESKDGYTLC